ncbi:MAG: dephospho-CoA kinase [Chloroflexota bacterium]
MSAWAGKYAIGLTGNIGTGKSVVRKMLEHLGAYSIDADTLGHRSMTKGGPAYQPVIDTFGKWVLNSDDQIDRIKLSRIVFSNPEALALLEDIIHPLVMQAIDLLVQRSFRNVIVIEAIKLLESELHSKCDSIWVTYLPVDIQLERLIRQRKISEDEARRRINAQPPQQDKLKAADVVIRNDGSFEDTWLLVVKHWEKIIPEIETTPVKVSEIEPGQLFVTRGKPQQAGEIATFISKMGRRETPMTRDDVMSAFGEKAYMLLHLDGELVGLVGWQVENLITRIDELYLKPGIPRKEAIQTLMTEIDSASHELLSEAALLFISPEIAKEEEIWQTVNFKPRSIESLGVRAWQEAALESKPPNTVMLFKQLRKDRVLRPV